MGKILVTGGLGFIGSHTVVELINEGFQVIIADDLSNSQIETLDKLEKITNQKIPFYEIDVVSRQTEEIFERNQIDGIIHFAGFKAVGESVSEPLKYYQNNLSTTINLLNLAKKYGSKKFIFSSSATVYGDNISPLREDMKLMPTTNPYGETKAMSERIITDFTKASPDFGAILLRYFNPIGAHQSGLIGEVPNGKPNNLMPFITQVAAGKREKLSVFGNDYDTIDGTGVRDYIHVVDLARGHVAALKHIKPGVEIYNLGTGSGISVLQLVKAFEQENNIQIPFEIAPRRDGDIAICYADTQKAAAELGFTTTKTISDMVCDAWNFEKNL